MVSSCGSKKKSHYNSRVSLHEAPTKKQMLHLAMLKRPRVGRISQVSVRCIEVFVFQNVLETLESWQHARVRNQSQSTGGH